MPREEVLRALKRSIAEKPIPFNLAVEEDGLYGKVSNSSFIANAVLAPVRKLGILTEEELMPILTGELRETTSGTEIRIRVQKSIYLCLLWLALLCISCTLAPIMFLRGATETGSIFSVLGVVSAVWLLSGRKSVIRSAKMLKSRLSILQPTQETED